MDDEQRCPVCHCDCKGAVKFSFAGLSGHECSAVDCVGCGSRYVNFQEEAHLELHSNDDSVYGRSHTAKVHKILEAFNNNEKTLLRKLLIEDDQKNSKILDAIDSLSAPAKIIEFGCSLGYLSSYSILAGHDFLGIDISAHAISFARGHFGPHFEIYDQFIPELQAADLIYHVGTIGCVSDPRIFVDQQMSMLKKGQGRLLFNAPNREAAENLGEPWLRGALPPDLTILYSQAYWEDRFANYDCDIYSLYDSKYKSLRRKISNFEAGNPSKNQFSSQSDKYGWFSGLESLWRALFRSVTEAGLEILPNKGRFKALPAEFGLWIDVRG